MPQGTVKMFKMDRGFGFIAPDDGGGDVFVHAFDLKAAGLIHLSPGQKVTFDVVRDTKTGKPHAMNERVAQ
jgi:cold shock protein